MKLWKWSAGTQSGMVAAQNDYDARRLIRTLGVTGRIWLVQRKSGEAMPREACVVVIQ